MKTKIELKENPGIKIIESMINTEDYINYNIIKKVLDIKNLEDLNNITLEEAMQYRAEFLNKITNRRYGINTKLKLFINGPASLFARVENDYI